MKPLEKDLHYLDQTKADIEAEIGSLEGLLTAIKGLIAERDKRLRTTLGQREVSTSVTPATVEFIAIDPIVTISGPAEPGETLQAPTDPKCPPFDTELDIPKKRKRGRPATKARTMGTLNVGKTRASQSDKGLDVTNTPPEELPEIKRICKDCGKKLRLDDFREMGGLAVAFGPPRERCRSCHRKYILV